VQQNAAVSVGHQKEESGSSARLADDGPVGAVKATVLSGQALLAKLLRSSGVKEDGNFSTEACLFGDAENGQNSALPILHVYRVTQSILAICMGGATTRPSDKKTKSHMLPHYIQWRFAQT
jgi:hypothetical protein